MSARLSGRERGGWTPVRTWLTARGHYRTRVLLRAGPEPTAAGTTAGRDRRRKMRDARTQRMLRG